MTFTSIFQHDSGSDGSGTNRYEFTEDYDQVLIIRHRRGGGEGITSTNMTDYTQIYYSSAASDCMTMYYARNVKSGDYFSGNYGCNTVAVIAIE